MSEPERSNKSDLKKRFKQEPESKSAKLDERIELKCSPPDAYPVAQIVWLRNGHQITGQTKENKLSNKRRIYRSLLNPVRSRLNSRVQFDRVNGHLANRPNKRLDLMVADDSATNRSAIVNKSQTDSDENSSAYSNGQHNLDGEPNASGGGGDQNVDEDDQLVQIDERLFSKNDEIDDLDTNASSRPPNEDLSLSSNFVLTPDHSLIIRSLRREDSQSNYTCVAFNASGRRHSRTVTLKGIFVI